MNSGIKTNYWEFPPFRLDKTNAVLWRHEQAVPLRPKNFAALCYLVQRHGQLVTKEELLDAVWQHRFVAESVLKGCISELRQALQDDARNPAYLATVARRGYRFIAPVTENNLAPKREERAISCWPDPLAKGSDYWVGRAAAQGELLTIWQRSLERLRQIVFLTGESGIGKTTLIEMFLNQLSVHNPAVLRMRCVEHVGKGEALLPMIEAIERRCHAPGGSELIKLLHLYAPVWLTQLPSVLPPDEREALQREIFGASRERMIREGCELLETLSKDAPLILVLEDLHWSDDTTLDFLRLLARRSTHSSLLVLATYRPAEASVQMHPVTSTHRELHLRGISSEIRVDPFSLDEIQDYLIRRFPGAKIPRSVSKALLTRTGGHPLFVSNLIEYLISEHGRGPLSEEIVVNKALPDTIRLVIEREIERLSVDEQHLLGVASAVGSQFSAVLLATVLDKEVAEIESCCDALVKRSQILVSDGVEQGSQGEVVAHYAFRHALYVEVLSQRLPTSLGIRLHLRIGECLEKLHGEHNLKYAAELALHFEKGWDWARAVRSLMHAATNGSHRFANGQALDYLLRALCMVERLPVEQQVETQINLLKQSSAIRRSMGDIVGAKTDLEDVLSTAKASGSHRAEILALIELSRILVWLDRRQCLELAEQAVAQSKVLDDKIIQSVVKGVWGGLKLLFGPWRAEYASACYEAMDIARASADHLVLHTRLTQHIYIELLASRYRTASTTAEEALTLSRTLGDGYMFIVGHYYYGLALLHLGEWGKLRQVAEESRRAFECNEARLPLRFHRQVMMAWLHVEAGDFEGAKAYCEEVLSESHGDWVAFIEVHCSPILGRAFLGLGDYGRAIQCFDSFFEAEKKESLPLFFNYFFPACQGAAETWLAMGNFKEARYYAQRLHDLASRAPEYTYLAISHSLLAEISASENALDKAGSQLIEALKLVENAEVPLAAWRVYGVAEKLHYLRGEEMQASENRLKKQNAIKQLIHSLSDTDPLSEHMRNLNEMCPLVSMDVFAMRNRPPANFNRNLSDAA